MLKNTIHIGTSAISVMFFGRQKNSRKKEKKIRHVIDTQH